MFKRIAIIGVGLIGGSIGLAIKKRRPAAEVIGIGRREISVRKALAKKSIDKGTLDIGDGVKGADLIIIATPVDKVISKIREAALYADKGAVIIDVNSTKDRIVAYADRIMPAGIYFVGAHPMAGSEHSGVSYASKDLFVDTVCIITPTVKTDRKSLEKVKRLWKLLGADLIMMSPKEHDRIVANISHLPHILSYCLCNSVGTSDLKAAGPGFKDSTRIAKSDPDMWAEIFIQNRTQALTSIGNFQKRLKTMKKAIGNKDFKALNLQINKAKAKRDSIG